MVKPKANQAKKTNKVWYHTKSLILVALSAFFVYNVVHELLTTRNLNVQLAEAKKVKEEMREEEEELSAQKEMLQNPEYVARFAKGKLLVSQEGEQIFALDKEKDK